jgi:hypothetical protein
MHSYGERHYKRGYIYSRVFTDSLHDVLRLPSASMYSRQSSSVSARQSSSADPHRSDGRRDERFQSCLVSDRSNSEESRLVECCESTTLEAASPE